MSKKNPKKLSRREREEQRQMRRWMLFGGGAFCVAAAAGVGMTFIPPTFPSLEGEGSMEDRMVASGLGPNFVKLTEGPVEALIIGTTSCSFCRDFVKNGLDDLVAFAREKGIGLAYASTGTSLDSLASTQLISGFAGEGVTDPEMIQAVYAASSSLGDKETFDKVAKEIGAQFDVNETLIQEITEQEAIAVTRDIQALGNTFPIQGTPIFFVQSKGDKNTINWFSGWPGSAGLQRQIEAARNA